MPRAIDPRPRRSLWAIPVNDLGGVARHVLDVIREGVPGWHVVVLAPPGPLADRCRDAGAAVVTDTFGPSFGAPRSVAALRRAIRRLRPTIVHSHLAFADVVAPAAVAAASVSPRPLVISTEHGIARNDLVYHSSRSRSNAMAAVHTRRLRHVDGVVAVSGATRLELNAKWNPLSTLPVRIVRNGVDRANGTIESAAPVPGLRIGSLSRLAPEKGLFELIDAFTRVHEHHPEATRTIAGVGPLEAELRARIDARSLGSAASLCGFVEPATFLPTIDVLAQLSVWENCSYALLDAMVNHLGVVATDVGGNPELVPAPCLVPLGDVAAAADAIVAQGLKPESRPRLPDDWPDVAAMTAALAAFYDERCA
jgi:glycosyltransferase involved in cell wall biosynthesis